MSVQLDLKDCATKIATIAAACEQKSAQHPELNLDFMAHTLRECARVATAAEADLVRLKAENAELQARLELHGPADGLPGAD